MDLTSEPPVDRLLPVSLSVEGKGDALVEIRSDLNYSVVFQHEVTAVSVLKKFSEKLFMNDNNFSENFLSTLTAVTSCSEKLLSFIPLTVKEPRWFVAVWWFF